MNDAIEVSWQDPESDIDMLLSEIPTGYKVQIKRTDPDWCKGVVATVDFDPTDPVSAKWIVERFGGRKYQIKVLDERGRYKYIRSITFPDPPLKDGAAIKPGPNGAYIFADAPDSTVIATAPAPVHQNNDMSELFRTMLQMQTQQASQMQTLMMTLLTKTLDSSKTNPPPAPILPAPVDPQTHMKNTLEMFKGMEELRILMGSRGGDAVDGEPLNPLYEAVIDKVVNKFTAPSPPAPQQQNTNLQQNRQSNLDFALEAKDRLNTMSDEEKSLLLSQVFKDDQPETSVDSGHAEDLEVDSLLSPEDEELLGNEETDPENESETL